MSYAEHHRLVEDFLEEVRELQAQGIDRERLKTIAARLAQLAERRDLFDLEDFPVPGPDAGKTAHRYRFNDHGDEAPTLYLNALLPGKRTVPHNHETWAIIVAVQGQEFNRVYRRRDDGRDPAFADLALDREVAVEPGTSIEFLGDDIHDIRTEGSQPTLHFHLYGRPLEALDGRFGVSPEGRVQNYNRSQMEPSVAVPRA